MSRKKQNSTYNRFVEAMTPTQKKEFEKEYKDLLISEMLLAAMEEDGVSVKELAKAAGVSTTIIQDVRSGKSDTVSLKSMVKILNALGYQVSVQRDGLNIPLNMCLIDNQ